MGGRQGIKTARKGKLKRRKRREKTRNPQERRSLAPRKTNKTARQNLEQEDYFQVKASLRNKIQSINV